MKYDGAPCIRCGATLRYVSSGGCVACHMVWSRSPERKAYMERYHARTRYRDKWRERPDLLQVRTEGELLSALSSGQVFYAEDAYR